MGSRMKAFTLPVRSFQASDLSKFLQAIATYPKEIQDGIKKTIPYTFIQGMKDMISQEKISPYLAILSGVRIPKNGNANDNFKRSMHIRKWGAKSNVYRLAVRDRALGLLWQRMNAGYSVRLTPKIKILLNKAGYPVHSTTKVLSYRPRNMFQRMLRQQGSKIKQQIGIQAALIANKLAARI